METENIQEEKLNAAINGAVTKLHSSERGRVVAGQLHELLTGPATGLDAGGQQALAILVLAFTQAGKRGFAFDLDLIPVGERYPFTPAGAAQLAADASDAFAGVPLEQFGGSR